MRHSNGEVGPAAFILVALIVVAAGWGLLQALLPGTRSDSSVSRKEVAGRSSLPGSSPLPAAGAGPSDLSPNHADEPNASTDPPRVTVARQDADSRGTVAVDAGAGDPAGQSVYASRLAGRPGYYSPDDPESLSVVTGRREAPAVDLELTGGATSLEDLGRALLAALAAKDESALAGLRVTKHEFRVICWPEFPESRPITNITLDDAWMMSAAQSHSGAARAVSLYGGRDLELVGVETAEPFAYGNFNRYSDVVLLARDRSTREVNRLTFAPSVIERHGRYKALLYRDR